MEDIKSVEINRDKLRRDGGTQPREALDQDHIQDLIHALEKGEKLPAILAYYDGENYWLCDGFHRDAAYEAQGIQTIEAVIRQGTLADAQWHSFSVNQHLALKRSNSDKQRAVVGALKHPYGTAKSNCQIAEHCGVDETTIRRWREKLESGGEITPQTERDVVTKNGKAYKLDTTNIGVAQNEEKQKFKVNCPDLPYHGQTVELMEVKSGDCYNCKTQEGDIYPFFKKELIGVNDDVVTPNNSENITIIRELPSARERLIALVVRLPEEKLEEAIALLLNFSAITEPAAV